MFLNPQNHNMRWGGSTPPHSVIISVLTHQGGRRFDPVRRGLPLLTTFRVIIPVSTWRGGSTPPLCNCFDMRRVYPSSLHHHSCFNMVRWVYASSLCHYSHFDMRRVYPSSSHHHSCFNMVRWVYPSSSRCDSRLDAVRRSAPPFCDIIPILTKWGGLPLLFTLFFPFRRGEVG